MTKASENSFNAVRLLAALQVAYVHAAWHLDIGWNPVGWVLQFPGVPIFFAVSGCLVLDSLLRLRSIPQFLMHRASRIYPALFINIAVIEGLLYVAGQVDYSGVTIGRAVINFLIYGLTASTDIAGHVTHFAGLHSFKGFFQDYPSGVLWTLTVELSFYAIMLLFLFVRSRGAQTALIVVGSVLSLGYHKYLGKTISPLDVLPNQTVLPYLWMFGIGMLFRLWPPHRQWNKFGIPAVIFLIVLCSLYRGPVWFEYRIDPPALSIFQTFLVCLLGVWVGSCTFLRSELLAKTDMSYGIYLYHMLIVIPLMNVVLDHRAWWMIVIVLIGAMAAGAVSWHLIESPAMRLMRSLPLLRMARRRWPALNP